MNRSRIPLAAVWLALLISGCGQTGPLFLPPADGETAGERAPDDAGDSAEDERERD